MRRRSAEERVRLVVNLIEAALVSVRAPGASRFAEEVLRLPAFTERFHMARASFDV
jgi:hypothetical protein